jgi:glycerol-3-phosphate acyltransferase PlsY
MVISLVISILIAYILGSIPTSYWLGKWFKGLDIREHGSKNPGATNALRILGKPLGFTTLFLDIMKGWAAVIIARHGFHLTLDWMLVLVGLAAVFGHIFTLFLHFKGGKGVATTFGIFLAFTPIATLCTIGIFIITITFSRYVSLASILSAIAFPIFIYYFQCPLIYVFLGIILGLFIIIRHKSNIQRILNGTENKIFAKK